MTSTGNKTCSTAAPRRTLRQSGLPTKQAADAAVHFVITGNRNAVTVVGSQTASGGDAKIEVSNGSAPAPNPERWWTRWRKRGLVIGLSTFIAAVAGVFQWLEWTPWK
jgi:hypothetical protein